MFAIDISVLKKFLPSDSINEDGTAETEKLLPNPFDDAARVKLCHGSALSTEDVLAMECRRS